MELLPLAALKDLLLFLGYASTIGILIFRAGKFTKAIEAMQVEITALKEVAKVVADVLTTVAVQKVEMAHLRSDIDEMKHGRGFISNGK